MSRQWPYVESGAKRFSRATKRGAAAPLHAVRLPRDAAVLEQAAGVGLPHKRRRQMGE